MVVLAGSSAVISPLLLSVFLPWLSRGQALHVNLGKIVGTLLITQLLPLLAGLLVKHFRPQVAARLQNPLELASKIMNLGAGGLILAAQFQMLIQIKLMGFIGMLILLLATLGIGWLSGGDDMPARRAMALTTSLRNVGVSLVIVTGSFGGTPAVSAALAYGIVEIFGALLLALWWGRQQDRTGA
jgi:bile acid:Na+ symporter, BASS family